MHPIELTVADAGGRRSRLTVFFRLLLVLPHVAWLAAWSVLVVLAVVVGWVAALALGRLPGALHRFLARYVRYTTHVNAFLALVGNPFPGFTGAPGTYPVEVTIAPAAPQRRAVTLFRLVLAVPALLLGAALAGGGGLVSLLPLPGGSPPVLGAVALLGWWPALLMARMPLGLRDAGAVALRYAARLLGYLLLLTDRYPSADLAGFPVAAPPARPVSLRVAQPPRRSRPTVFLRWLLVLPHVVWLEAWALAVLVAVAVNWLVTLVAGRPSGPLHGFTAHWLRYATRVGAYASLLADPFPVFTATGEYPVELEVGPPARQNRATTLFRGLLVWPALVIGGALGAVWGTAAFLGWWAALFTGRMPAQLEDLGAWGLGYGAQVQAYALLLTDRYPWSGPRGGPTPAPPASRPPPDWRAAPERPDPGGRP